MEINKHSYLRFLTDWDTIALQAGLGFGMIFDIFLVIFLAALKQTVLCAALTKKDTRNHHAFNQHPKLQNALKFLKLLNGKNKHKEKTNTANKCVDCVCQHINLSVECFEKYMLSFDNFKINGLI